VTLAPGAQRRAFQGAVALAGIVLVLLALTARDRTAPLDLTSTAPFAFLLAAVALGAGLGAAERGPASWRRPRTGWLLLTAGALGGALDAAARHAAIRLPDLTNTGIPALLEHGGPVIAPLLATRLVPAPGALSVGLLVGQAAAWLFGSPPPSYPALALVQLPLVVIAAELWLATGGRARTPRDMAVAGCLIGVGSTAAAYALQVPANTATEWLGRLIQDVLAGSVVGWLIGRAPLPFGTLLRPATRVDDDDDLYADG